MDNLDGDDRWWNDQPPRVLLCMQFGCSYDFFSRSGFIGFARSTLDPFSGGVVYLDVVFFGSG